MSKNEKWGLAETPSAQFRLELGQRNFDYPTYLREFYKSAVRTRAASANRSEDIADFPQKSHFWAFSEGVFRVYLHTQASPGKVTSYQS